MLIDELPVELLMEIFSYLRRYDNVSLVSKHFYEVVCSMNEICLLLGSYMFNRKNHLQILDSIRGTNRRISKLNIDFCKKSDAEMRTTISIIEMCSKTIKYLRLRVLNFEMFDFLEILRLVPYVEHLVLESLGVHEFILHHMSSGVDLNLHRLKTLHLLNGRIDFMVVFNRLPPGVLTELRIDNHNLDELTVLFERQVNIKKLILNDFRLWYIPVADDFFDLLKLDSLHLTRNYCVNSVSRIISKQTELRSLILCGYIVFDELLMNIIINELTELETVTIDLSDTPAALIRSIDKLTWRDLTLLPYTLGKNSKKIPDSLMRFLATRLPNLKILRLYCLCDLNVIRRYFNFIEVLQMEAMDGWMQQEDNQKDDFFNPKLIEFVVNNELPFQKYPFLTKFIASYPNLRKLAFRSSTPVRSLHFKLILNELTKLESLSLQSSNLTVDDLIWLALHKNNLKFIMLSGLMVNVTDEVQKRLRERFLEIKISLYGMCVNLTGCR